MCPSGPRLAVTNMPVKCRRARRRGPHSATPETCVGQRRIICHAQYHEVIRELVGKWTSYFTLVVCILAALGSCLPQIVASSANVYRINQNLNKRCVMPLP